jgi:tetratricopeptide (TPR) repeat protein
MHWFFIKKWPPFLLIGVVTLVTWGQTVTFQFVWDDGCFIRDLQSVRSLRHIPEMFYRLDAQATLPDDFRVFRPIRTAHYALLHFLDGREVPQPWIYHLANVCWHGGTAMMLFAALTRLLPQLNGRLTEADAHFWSLVVALAYAVHPVVSEVVCWAKSLDDILAAFFTLAALRELLPPTPGRFAYWRGLLFFALAVYSKESVVPFAVMPFVLLRTLHRLDWKQCAFRTLPFLIVAALYLINRELVIGRTSQTAPLSGTYGQTLIDMLPVVPRYFRLLCGVPPFFIDYSYLRAGQSLWSAEVMGGLALLVALLAIGFLSWHRRGGKILGFGLLWTGLFLLPVSNLVPMMQYMAERFLYLPLIGWLIAFVGLILVLPLQKFIRAVALGLVLLWAVTAWDRSWIWQDGITLFVRSSQEGPRTQRVENNAVIAILNLPLVHQFFSSNETNQEVSVKPLADPAANERVLKTLAEAQRLFPTNPTVLSRYGIGLAATGKPEKALPFLEQAAQLQPGDLNGWLNLTRAALDAGQVALAESALEKADGLARNNPNVLQLRFKFYWQSRDYLHARETMSRLNQIAPSEEHAYWLSEVEGKLKAASQPATNTPSGTKK